MPSTVQRAARLKAGLCGACGAKPHSAGRSRCEECLQRARESSTKARVEQAKRGLCEAGCGRERVTGKTRCRACAIKYAARQLGRDRAKRPATRPRAEEWRTVRDWPLYEVSSFGRVRSCGIRKLWRVEIRKLWRVAHPLRMGVSGRRWVVPETPPRDRHYDPQQDPSPVSSWRSSK